VSEIRAFLFLKLKKNWSKSIDKLKKEGIAFRLGYKVVGCGFFIKEPF
jgi:hypothetical protein